MIYTINKLQDTLEMNINYLNYLKDNLSLNKIKRTNQTLITELSKSKPKDNLSTKLFNPTKELENTQKLAKTIKEIHKSTKKTQDTIYYLKTGKHLNNEHNFKIPF